MATANEHKATIGGLCVIGAGSMGSAIAAGLVNAHALDAGDLVVCNPHEGRLEPFKKLGARTFTSNVEGLKASDAPVLLAVKPQVLPGVLTEIASCVEGRLVVSIAAGVTTQSLEEALPGARVVRAMPNLPLQVGMGATAVCGGGRASADDVELTRSLFAALGDAEVMREDQLDAEGALVGCEPAYVACFVDALTRAGIRSGLTAASARTMVLTTMKGVCEQLLSSGEHPRAYMEKVTSPGGTTAEGLKAMEPLLEQASYDAVDAALRRTAELAG